VLPRLVAKAAGDAGFFGNDFPAGIEKRSSFGAKLPYDSQFQAVRPGWNETCFRWTSTLFGVFWARIVYMVTGNACNSQGSQVTRAGIEAGRRCRSR
jgi:hypothetical protein